MSDPVSTPPDRESLAAEYVLGTLEADEAAAVLLAARQDRALGEAIDGWEARLAPLALLADPAAPSPALWDGIAAELGLAQASARPRLATVLGTPPRPVAAPVWRAPARHRPGLLLRVWRDADVWRLAAMLALVAGVSGVVFETRAFRLATPVAVATLTGHDSAKPEARAEIGTDGGLVLRPDHPLTVAADSSLAVWALPLGASTPTLLGAMPPEGGRVRAPPLPDGSQVMVTLEPRAGPGATPGPALFAGVVTSVRRGGAPRG